MTFHESYGGDVSVLELDAIRQFNVSPMDHELLCEQYGRENHKQIHAAILAGSKSGQYRMELPW
jgi:hypothetical protein